MDKSLNEYQKDLQLMKIQVNYLKSKYASRLPYEGLGEYDPMIRSNRLMRNNIFGRGGRMTHRHHRNSILPKLTRINSGEMGNKAKGLGTQINNINSSNNIIDLQIGAEGHRGNGPPRVVITDPERRENTVEVYTSARGNSKKNRSSGGIPYILKSSTHSKSLAKYTTNSKIQTQEPHKRIKQIVRTATSSTQKVIRVGSQKAVENSSTTKTTNTKRNENKVSVSGERSPPEYIECKERSRTEGEKISPQYKVFGGRSKSNPYSKPLPPLPLWDTTLVKVHRGGSGERGNIPIINAAVLGTVTGTGTGTGTSVDVPTTVLGAAGTSTVPKHLQYNSNMLSHSLMQGNKGSNNSINTHTNTNINNRNKCVEDPSISLSNSPMDVSFNYKWESIAKVYHGALPRKSSPVPNLPPRIALPPRPQIHAHTKSTNNISITPSIKHSTIRERKIKINYIGYKYNVAKLNMSANNNKLNNIRKVNVHLGPHTLLNTTTNEEIQKETL